MGGLVLSDDRQPLKYLRGGVHDPQRTTVVPSTNSLTFLKGGFNDPARTAVVPASNASLTYLRGGVNDPARKPPASAGLPMQSDMQRLQSLQTDGRLSAVEAQLDDLSEIPEDTQPDDVRPGRIPDVLGEYLHSWGLWIKPAVGLEWWRRSAARIGLGSGHLWQRL